MTSSVRTIIALGFGLGLLAAVNAGPSMQIGEPETQKVGDCKWPLQFSLSAYSTWNIFANYLHTGISWYMPQLHTPPETCNDVVTMHPGLDLATFLKLNPAIHPYCENMQLDQKVCIRAIQETDCPKLAEPSPKPWEASSVPKPQQTSSAAWH